jgi:hypothetical protein
MESAQCITSGRDDRRLSSMAGMVGLTFLSTPALAAPTVPPESKIPMQANYGKLPLSFEVNQGQTDAQVKFLARGQGYSLFLTPTETVLSLKKPKVKINASALTKSVSSSETSGSILRMNLVGANSAPKIVGKEALPGRVNYLIGKDPSQWHTKIPTYGKVAYEGVYPGVDLVYYGNQGQLEYDFVVAPGADPHDIKLAFKGSGPVEISPAGDLVLHTENGAIRMHKPVVYQEINGIRKSIDGSYMLKEKQTVGFQVAAYDTAHPLIIDPVLAYSTYLGGSEQDTASSIAIDLQGRIYVAGETSSTDFPALSSIQPNLTRRADSVPIDVFIAQLTPDGTALRYATYLGGIAVDISRGIVVDPQGQATVTGITFSPDFPTHNALQPTLGGSRDVFVAQLTADGAALRYSTYLGGSKEERVGGIAVDRQGQIVLAGLTRSADFPVKNAFQPTFGGGYSDAFVTQFTADGKALRYSTYLGGSDSDKGSGIAVDLQGRAYVTGDTESLNFPTKNALQPTLHLGPGTSGRDAFVAQLTADGKALHYSTYLGGRGDDWCHDIAVDPQGQAYVSGETTSTDFPIKNAFQPAFRGGNDDVFGAVVGKDVFIAKLTANGRTLSYSTYLGGSGNETGHGLAVDLRGQAIVTGSTDSPDFPIKNALQPTFGGGYSDAFVAQLTADGEALSYSTYLGGSDLDGGSGIAVDQHGLAYVTGSTSSPDFPTVNALQPVLGGNSDVFVAKIRNDSQP